MSDEPLELALDYLRGRVDYSTRLPRTTFKLSPDEEGLARTAIADLLRSTHPPRRLLDVLAALFDPNDSLSSGRRRLVLSGQSGKGKGRPRDVAREIEAIMLIRLRMLDGLTLEKAIGEVAASGVGLTEDGLWDIWRRNPILREEILRSQRGQERSKPP